jgi:hypothetical protein
LSLTYPTQHDRPQFHAFSYKDFLPFCGLSLHCGNFWYSETFFNLMQSYLPICVLISWAVGVLFRK